MKNDQDHFEVLRRIQKKPESSQRELAEELGFSLGKLNYCLKALQKKGFVKLQNFQKQSNKTWLKNLGVNYNTNTKNTLSSPDSLLFNNIFNNINSGAQHSIPISTSFNIFKHININPSIRYNEKWFFKKENSLNMDTTSGFWSIRDFQYSTQLSTKIYGFIGKQNK